MRPVECPREQDVLDALAAGRWPARCERELHAHVAGCHVCADLVEVAGPLADAHDALWPEIRVPSAGTVWWRAQLRARKEAARQASRPIIVVQVLGGAAALVALVALFPAGAPWLAGFSSVVPRLPQFDLQALRVPSILDLGMWGWVAIAAFVTWAVVAPLAIYLAVSED